jgi:hypothetical protein
MSKRTDHARLQKIRLTVGSQSLMFRLSDEMLVDRAATLEKVRGFHNLAARLLDRETSSEPAGPARIPPLGANGARSAATDPDMSPFPWDLYDGISPPFASFDPFSPSPDPSRAWDEMG